ncbi:leucyl aminopeptidase [Sandaracinobacter sp. RS1-74]|uniref:leucyl aminopeptidase n=1 Tax=Sandaracinobacteroides sayramensis TaxID=2913411 RepID=UPI001EDBD53A|nr:leucyl aminopeptidase [Sandaracinobacteroides sayramensis]MCG2840705.1 leucyl aminopeptidase [Sandaracinobacteroides sayramensis]
MTDVSFAAEQDLSGSAALLVFVGEGGELTAGAKAVEKASDGQLGRAMKAAGFTGKKGKLLEILAPAGLGAARLLVAGLGEGAKADARLFEDIGGEVAAKLQTVEKQVAADFSGIADLAVATDVAAAHFAHGVELRNWRLDTYRTKLKDEQKPKLAKVTLVGVGKSAKPLVERLHKVAEGVAFAKELITEPGNIIYPESFVERVREKVEPLGIKVTVLDEKKLKKLGAGSMLGVGQGSVRPPRLLALEWNGTGDEDATPLALVGKGVTFDTGGISLKPGPGMEDMKWDMGGAGAVAGTMVALAGRKAKARVIGVCGLVENMPDGNAQRPGDIVTSMSGQTIEVLNTDAEGRLVLNDCLTWTQRTYKPKVILDFATLTGAIIISLAHYYAGVFSNSDSLWNKLDEAGKSVNDLVWRQPLSEPGGHYDQMIDSTIADMKNIGGREGGSITAAQFLQRYVDEGVEWAHVDIAGAVWRPKAAPLYDKGATGFGVRLVDALVAKHFES